MARGINTNYKERFDTRHNGPSVEDIEDMLKLIGVDTLDELIDQTVPDNIRNSGELNLPEAKSEFEFLREFKELPDIMTVLFLR